MRVVNGEGELEGGDGLPQIQLVWDAAEIPVGWVLLRAGVLLGGPGVRNGCGLVLGIEFDISVGCVARGPFELVEGLKD